MWWSHNSCIKELGPFLKKNPEFQVRRIGKKSCGLYASYYRNELKEMMKTNGISQLGHSFMTWVLSICKWNCFTTKLVHTNLFRTWKYREHFYILHISWECLTTDWVTGVRSSTEANDFPSTFCVQTSSEAHPASYPIGTRGPFPGGKAWLGYDADHSPHLLLRSRMSRSYTASPLSTCMVCMGQVKNE
jgi:hypothetical protein